MRDSSQLALTELSPSAFSTTWEILKTGIQDGVAPGMVAGLWNARDPERIHVASIGQRRTVPSVLPLLPETVFDLASVTKIMSTATLAAVLVDRRWIGWNTPVKAILPDFRFADVELRHLLSHTSGLPAWQPLWERLVARFAPTPVFQIPISERQRAMRELVFSVDLENKPEEKVVYSDIGFFTLGFALEEVLRMPLDRAVKKLVWDPMGIQGAYYTHVKSNAETGKVESVAATEESTWRGGIIQGQVHDENCWVMGGYAGHAGAFGSVRDVLQFARRLFDRFLTRETLKACWTRVSIPIGCDRTMGWDTPSATDSMVGQRFSRNAVGHWGFTGTSLWIDPVAEIAVTLLTNRVHPTRENMKIRTFRPRFHDAIHQDFSALNR